MNLLRLTQSLAQNVQLLIDGKPFASEESQWRFYHLAISQSFLMETRSMWATVK